MKRRTFKATVVTDDGNYNEIGSQNTFAWNSAIRATEAIVREYARSNYTLAEGSKPVTFNGEHGGEDIYRRYWTLPSGRRVMALVWEVL